MMWCGSPLLLGVVCASFSTVPNPLPANSLLQLMMMVAPASCAALALVAVVCRTTTLLAVPLPSVPWIVTFFRSPLMFHQPEFPGELHERFPVPVNLFARYLSAYQRVNGIDRDQPGTRHEKP